jgi:hypothetical protein
VIRIIISTIIALSVYSCKSTSPSGTAQLADATTSKKVVQGYDFSGFKTMNPAPKDMVCTAVLKAEQAACQEVEGVTIWADKCKVMCSKPIAPKGKVAGYNFQGFAISEALAEDMVCAAILTPEQEACSENGGHSQFAANCKNLCSVPISSGGKLAGYNFDGPQMGVSPLPDGFVCTQVLRPEEEACRKAGGKVTIANKCTVLCSVMISR